MITLEISLAARTGARLIAPQGLSTPGSAPISVHVEGAAVHLVGDPASAQSVFCLTPEADRICLRWHYVASGAPYPEALFAPRRSRYTRAADTLAAEAARVCARGGLAGLANHVAGLFQYGHPDESFHQGKDEIPQLCSLTEGSCVDINAYFIAAARAAGYQAGYVTGYFIPAEKRDWCEDMHCWVVTRDADTVQEWDIAHHLKMGTREIAPGLNPKPGVRVAMAHSMGLSFPALGVHDLKLVAEPMWLFPDGHWERAELTIAFDGYEALAG